MNPLLVVAIAVAVIAIFAGLSTLGQEKGQSAGGHGNDHGH